MTEEKTLVLIKPPCSSRVRAIINIFETYTEAGLVILSVKYVIMHCPPFDKLYGEHSQKPFFPLLKKAYLGKNFIAACLEGKNAINKARKINGVTDPLKAAKGTLRRKFGDLKKRDDGFITPHNVVHGSDSPENAAREILVFFP